MLADKINIRLEAAPSMATAFLPIKNGQKKNQRFIPLALLPYIARLPLLRLPIALYHLKCRAVRLSVCGRNSF